MDKTDREDKKIVESEPESSEDNAVQEELNSETEDYKSREKEYIETDLEKIWFRETDKYPRLSEAEEKECGRDLKQKTDLRIIRKNNHISLKRVFENLVDNPHAEEVISILEDMYREIGEQSLVDEEKKVMAYHKLMKAKKRPLTPKDLKEFFGVKTCNQEIDNDELLEEVKRYAKYNTAKYKMIHANLRLIVRPARKYAAISGVEFIDLVSEGSLGLMKAVDRFDVDRGFHFSTYAVWWIRQAVSRYAIDNSSILKVTETQYKDAKAFKENVAKLEEETDKKYTAEDLVDIFDMPYEDVVALLYFNPQPISLETPVGDDEDKTTMGAMIPDKATDFDENLFKREQRACLEENFQHLTPEEELVIRLSSGMNDENRVYQEYEISKIIKKSRFIVSRITKRAYQKLRVRLNRDERAKSLFRELK